MGEELYQTEPIFKRRLDQCFAFLKKKLDMDLKEVIYPTEKINEGGFKMFSPKSATKLHQTRFVQPAIFSIEYALAGLWLDWGVEPQAMLGYSLGEYVSACLSGVFSLEDALWIVAKRAELIQSLN